jgi:hypothetical protein
MYEYVQETKCTVHVHSGATGRHRAAASHQTHHNTSANAIHCLQLGVNMYRSYSIDQVLRHCWQL